MIHNFIGVEAFSEVGQAFKLFSKVLDIKTNACDTCISGATHPQMNYVYNVLTQHSEQLRKDLENLNQTEIPMLVIMEQNSGNEIASLLKEYGLELIGTAQTKTLDLSRFRYQSQNKLKIKQVETSEELQVWRSLAAVGFAYPENQDQNLMGEYLKPGKHHETVRLFLGYENHTPIGQSMLVLGKNFAMNMWSSVLPEYRRRGYLTEMISYRMKIAQDAGYKKIVVQCMPMSRIPYDRLGYLNQELLNIYICNGNNIQVNNF